MQTQQESKMNELMKRGYEDTGKTFKIMRGPYKGKAFPVFAMKGDVAGIVFNREEDKVEFIFKLPMPYSRD